MHEFEPLAAIAGLFLQLAPRRLQRVLVPLAGLVGAVFGGMYGGYGLTLVGHLDISTYRAEALRCLLAFLAGVALAAAAIFLERVLRVPPDQPSPPSTGDSKHAARA